MIETLNTLGGMVDKGTFDRGQANDNRLEKGEWIIRTVRICLFLPS